MDCDQCGSGHTRVIEEIRFGKSIRRRRKCDDCGRILETNEYVVSEGGTDGL